MKLREWIADNVGYRFGGCCYNYFSSHKQLFDFIEAKIPDDFLGREISDLGCGDGQNTFKIKKIFKPKKITGYERNDFLIRRAEQRGLKVKKVDLNKKVPSGEMVVSTFALHHLHDKEETLRQIVKNFRYVFLCEPVRDLYHFLFDAGRTLRKKEWIDLFDKAFKKYKLYQFKSSLIVFFQK